MIYYNHYATANVDFGSWAGDVVDLMEYTKDKVSETEVDAMALEIRDMLGLGHEAELPEVPEKPGYFSTVQDGKLPRKHFIRNQTTDHPGEPRILRRRVPGNLQGRSGISRCLNRIRHAEPQLLFCTRCLNISDFSSDVNQFSADEVPVFSICIYFVSFKEIVFFGRIRYN